MRLPRPCVFCLLLISLTAFSSFGTEIVMKSGIRYSKVTVIRKTPKFVKIHTEFGDLQLATEQIGTIDGQPLDFLTPAPPPTPLPVERATPAPVETPRATPEIAPPIAAAKTPSPTPSPAAKPVYHHDFTMDWRLGALLGGILLWLAHLVWVQHEMNRRARPAALWNTVVLLLPGVGLALFLLSKFLGKKGPKTPYGGKEDVAAAAKKRKLFSGKSTTEQPKGQSIGLRFVDDQNHVMPTTGLGGKVSGLETARLILEAAIVERASDIHIEPQADLCRVRFRVDGQLAEHNTLDPESGKRLIASLKSLGGIDISEKRKAQDGRFRVKTEIRDVDFRVATANSIHGEKIVIRILDRKGGLFSLDQVGMSAELETVFDQTIHTRNGMIIVTGPTGSGKTSTLYAALSRLDRTKLNVMTIEDPVEYELEGATQIPVAPKAGTTYESGLRSILRQDPDVILVGEMRDAEAATVAIRAALTGHLVFTSLHTRDSIATLIRLEEMGMDRSQMASALIMLVAQRLVRVLCPACRREAVSTGQELIDLDIEWEPGAPIFEAVGCPECDGLGFKGRTGIFEILVLDDALRQAIQQGETQENILTLARQNGFRPYREDGATKVLLGITTAAEVLEAN